MISCFCDYLNILQNSTTLIVISKCFSRSRMLQRSTNFEITPFKSYIPRRVARENRTVVSKNRPLLFTSESEKRILNNKSPACLYCSSSSHEMDGGHGRSKLSNRLLIVEQHTIAALFVKT